MKKYICGAALSAALLASSALASAAANPFSDVPADHWAYDAVAQLADDGVIEGYGDGTYRGQNEITRYEMAQMVAKAMAKEEQVNAQQKAMINRLAAEFAEELGNLGVRVENLEQKADNVKWEGELRYVHLSHRDENAAGTTDEHSVNTLQLRLLPVATVNDHWKVRARLTGSVKLSEDQASNVALSYLYADGNYGNLRIQAGKMSHFWSYSDDGLVVDSWFSGAILTYGTKTKVMVEGGRWNMGNAALSVSGKDKLGGRTASDYTAKHYGIGVDHATGKLQAGVAYRHYESDVFQFLPAYRDGAVTDKAASSPSAASTASRRTSPSPHATRGISKRTTTTSRRTSSSTTKARTSRTPARGACTSPIATSAATARSCRLTSCTARPTRSPWRAASTARKAGSSAQATRR